jgi:hypothetical protein
VKHGIVAGCIAGALVLAQAGTASAQSAPMEPHRAARIEAACPQARRTDWGHIAIGATMASMGALGYIPSLVQDTSQRPPVTSLGAGLGLGLIGGGLILALRPMSAGAARLITTCELLDGPRRGNPVVLRDAERYLDAVADAQRDWAVRASIIAGGVTVVGVALSAVLFSDPHDKFFWSGVFMSVPLAFWLDLLSPPPVVQASLRFRHGGFSLGSIAPVPLERGAGISLGGVFF